MNINYNDAYDTNGTLLIFINGTNEESFHIYCIFVKLNVNQRMLAQSYIVNVMIIVLLIVIAVLILIVQKMVHMSIVRVHGQQMYQQAPLLALSTQQNHWQIPHIRLRRIQ